jgi:hypothetical protein
MKIDPPPVKAPDNVRLLAPDFFQRLLTTVRLLWYNFDLRSYEQYAGTTASTQGASVTVAHGVDAAKIINLCAVVNPSASTGVIPNTTTAGLEYTVSFDATNITITNSAANSSGILSKTFAVFITVKK